VQLQLRCRNPGNFVLGLSTAAEDERGIILADAEDVAVAAGGVEGAALPTRVM